MKAMIIPGNGNEDVNCMWYPYVKDKLKKEGFDVVLENMPDPELARRKYWLPFIEKKLEGGNNSLLIGHSSGAIAILRYLETHTCDIAVLIAVYHTDLGYESEKISGYFDTPWDWDRIKKNAKRIIIFASRDDPHINIDEPRFVKEKLHAEYHEFEDSGHFQSEEFFELISVIDNSQKKTERTSQKQEH